MRQGVSKYYDLFRLWRYQRAADRLALEIAYKDLFRWHVGSANLEFVTEMSDENWAGSVTSIKWCYLLHPRTVFLVLQQEIVEPVRDRRSFDTQLRALQTTYCVSFITLRVITAWPFMPRRAVVVFRDAAEAALFLLFLDSSIKVIRSIEHVS